MNEPRAMAYLRGIQTLQTHCTLFHPFIKCGDVIQVNFDIRPIDCDAEFLVGFDRDGHSWYGASRFQLHLNGEP